MTHTFRPQTLAKVNELADIIVSCLLTQPSTNERLYMRVDFVLQRLENHCKSLMQHQVLEGTHEWSTWREPFGILSEQMLARVDEQMLALGYLPEL